MIERERNREEEEKNLYITLALNGIIYMLIKNHERMKHIHVLFATSPVSSCSSQYQRSMKKQEQFFVTL